MKLGDVTYLRILLTTRCNMRCVFCHREGVSSGEVDIDESVLVDAVGKMHELGFRKFKLMGGEPTLYPNLRTVVGMVRERIGSSDLSMISNGMAESALYEELLSSGIDRLNISVHGWAPECFSKITGVSDLVCDKVKHTIVCLAEKHLINKLNYVVRQGVNESDFFNLLDFAGEMNLMVDALNLLSVGDGTAVNGQYYSLSAIESLVRSRYVVKEVLDVRNRCSLPSKLLKLANGACVNLKISELNRENVFNACSCCPVRKSCVEGIKALRLTPAGFLQPCLMRSDNTLDLNRLDTKADIASYLLAL